MTSGKPQYGASQTRLILEADNKGIHLEACNELNNLCIALR